MLFALFTVLLFMAEGNVTLGQEAVSWMRIVTDLGFAALVWFLLAKAAPNVISEFKLMLKDMQEFFGAQLLEARQLHRDSSIAGKEAATKQVQEHGQAIKALIESFEREQRYEREACEKRHNEQIGNWVETQKMVAEAFTVIREMRHLLANQVHAEGARQAAANLSKQPRRKEGDDHA